MMASHLVRLPAAATLVAALGIALTAAAPAQAHNDTGALVGGLIAGAVIGGAVVAASEHHHHHDNYYYYGGPAPAYYPPPPPVYGPVYGPGYCGAPPYPPCRTPVPY